MLTIFGKTARRAGCDVNARRDFLTIGGMALGGLALPDLLRAESEAKTGRSHKAIINIFLAGGPPHQDMWDLKPDAPAEIRGEFDPIKTNVPGIEICEMFPKMAAMMDKFAIIRSLADCDGDHDAYQCMTGRKKAQLAPPGGWPSMGAWVSKVQGPAAPAVPPHISMMYKTDHAPWGNTGGGGFVGMAHAPFRLCGGRENAMKADSMTLQGVTLERLADRNQLRASLDQFRREADNRGAMSGLDAFGEQALGILTSSKLAEALDVSREDPATLARYGEDNPEFHFDGAPRMVSNFCIARRLVEAGARVVSFNYSRWDWHGAEGKTITQGRVEFPKLDQALAALVTDLHERGLDRDVSVVCWGEFGRTPKINAEGRRDHWPSAATAIVAGGGMRTGQVIGATNKFAEHPVDRPVKFQEVFATLYTKAGIDLSSATAPDLHGRPQYLVDADIEPIQELM